MTRVPGRGPAAADRGATWIADPGNTHGGSCVERSVVLAAPPAFLIRPATRREWREEWKVIMCSWVLAYAHIFDPERIARVSTGRAVCAMAWREERAGKLGSWVACMRDQIVGTAGLHLREDGEAELSHLYVLPEHHGKGIGAALLDTCREAARARGCPGMLIWVLERTPAVAFYRSHDAIEIGRDTYSIDGQAEPTLVLRIRLSGPFG